VGAGAGPFYACGLNAVCWQTLGYAHSNKII
jgi:hypothetical protein